jgi:hypothetical protein
MLSERSLFLKSEKIPALLYVGKGPEYRPLSLFLKSEKIPALHYVGKGPEYRPSDGQKIPVERGWYLSPQKILLAENRVLQTGNGAENRKEKSRQCFMY